MTWVLIGSQQKSATEVTQLITNVIQAPDFIPEELTGFDAQMATTQLDAAQKQLPKDHPFVRDNWKQTNVNIVISTREENSTGDGKNFRIEGFYY